jgi:hypothetical protein
MFDKAELFLLRVLCHLPTAFMIVKVTELRFMNRLPVILAVQVTKLANTS